MRRRASEDRLPLRPPLTEIFAISCPVFLPESDNESVPSPVKPQPRIPYCKTYEEIRLEEIQAESAAYYSYQVEDYQSDVGGGKMKTRRTRKVCLYPQIGKEKNGEKGLDFEVLTLEEIRRRKRRKAAPEKEPKAAGAQGEPAASGDKGESTADFLKDAMKTLAELRETTFVRGVKRTLEDSNDGAERRKVKRTDTEGTGSALHVPPVKLRRKSPKRLVSVGDQAGDQLDELTSKDQQDSVDGETGDECSQVNATDRVDSSEESSSMSRRNEVEVRLCDSSTDEDQMQMERNEERSEERNEERKPAEDAKDIMASCDSLLNVNEDDYLTLDMASDDILKDIDALLKEKSSV